MSKIALLFSGYNQRAVIALCRYFSAVGHGFHIVASGEDDVIHRTDYAENVIFSRKDKTLGVNLFVDSVAISGVELVYVPTSEYMNRFVLDNREYIGEVGVEPGIALESAYNVLTSKLESQAVLKDVSNIEILETMDTSSASVPCVFKPTLNVFNGETLYPIICETDVQLEKALEEVQGKPFFAQKYVDGNSYYLCGYLSSEGGFECFWQENIAQQEGGKSMVLARRGENPGVSESEIFNKISALGYYGPIMIEFMVSNGNLFYIEINPRFWGPLQLALDCKSQILDLYLRDQFFSQAKYQSVCSDSRFYSWLYGAEIGGDLRFYQGEGKDLLVSGCFVDSDVYNKKDTRFIHGSC